MNEARNSPRQRAAALIAHRTWIAREALGRNEDPSEEAEAGGILEAEAQIAIQWLREAYEQTHKG